MIQELPSNREMSRLEVTWANKVHMIAPRAWSRGIERLLQLASLQRIVVVEHAFEHSKVELVKRPKCAVL